MQPEVFDSRALALLNRLASRKKEPTPPPGRAAPISQAAAEANAGRAALVAQMKTTGAVAGADRSGKRASDVSRAFIRVPMRCRNIRAVFYSAGQPQASAVAVVPNVGNAADDCRRASQVRCITLAFTRRVTYVCAVVE